MTHLLLILDLVCAVLAFCETAVHVHVWQVPTLFCWIIHSNNNYASDSQVVVLGPYVVLIDVVTQYAYWVHTV